MDSLVAGPCNWPGHVDYRFLTRVLRASSEIFENWKFKNIVLFETIWTTDIFEFGECKVEI